MASITLTIPDAVAQRVLDGVCAANNYSATLGDGSPNPETKLQFAKRMLKEMIMRWVKQAEIKAAEAAARTATEQDINTDIQIT